MNDVKIRILTEADLRAAQEVKSQLEQIVSKMDAADGVAQDYQKTILALNAAISGNQVATARQAETLANQIKLAESLGVNVGNLKNQYQTLYAELSKGHGGETMFSKIREDVNEIAKEIPGLSRLMGKIFEATASPIGAFTAGIGLAYEATKKFAETEVLWAKMDAALARSGHLMDGTRERYRHLMEEMADKSIGTTDEEWGKIILRLTQFGRSTQQVQGDIETIKKLKGVMGSLPAAEMAYERAMNGSFYALRRYGILIPEHISQLEKMATLRREAERFGGANLSDTLSGSWDKMTTNIERLVIALGTDLQPLFKPFKFAMNEIADTAKNLAHAVEVTIPPLAGLTNSVKNNTRSMGDARQDMTEYNRAWKEVQTEIDASVEALKKFDSQQEKSLNERKKFAKWQEDRDVAEIERSEHDPVKRAALIAQRKAATAQDAGQARDRLTKREVEEQQGIIQKAQSGISQSDAQMRAVYADPDIDEGRRELYRKVYAEQRATFQKQIAEAQDEISKLTDKMRMDAAENQHEIWEASFGSLKENVKTASESEKSSLKNRRIEQLTPDFLSSQKGGKFLDWTNNAGNIPQLDKLLDNAGEGQLDDFIKVLSAGGEQNTGYRFALARAKAAKARNQAMQAMIELNLATAEQDDQAAAAARRKKDEIQFGIQQQFRDDYSKWESGGRKGAAPIYPLANILPNGRISGSQGLPSSGISNGLQGLMNQYSDANYNRPTFNAPAQQYRPVDKSQANWFIDTEGFFGKPSNPATMVVVGFKDGSHGTFARGSNGQPDFTKPILSSGGGIASGGMVGMASNPYMQSLLPTGTAPRAVGEAVGGELGELIGGHGDGAHEGGWWDKGIGKTGLTMGNAITMASVVGGGILLGKGMKVAGHGLVKVGSAGLGYVGKGLGIGGHGAPAAGAASTAAHSAAPASAAAPAAAAVKQSAHPDWVGKSAFESTDDFEIRLQQEYEPRFADINARSAAKRPRTEAARLRNVSNFEMERASVRAEMNDRLIGDQKYAGRYLSAAGEKAHNYYYSVLKEAGYSDATANRIAQFHVGAGDTRVGTAIEKEILNAAAVLEPENGALVAAKASGQVGKGKLPLNVTTKIADKLAASQGAKLAGAAGKVASTAKSAAGATMRGAARFGSVPFIADLVDVGSSVAGGLSGGEGVIDTLSDKILATGRERTAGDTHWYGDLGEMSVSGAVASMAGKDVTNMTDSEGRLSATRNIMEMKQQRKAWAKATINDPSASLEDKNRASRILGGGEIVAKNTFTATNKSATGQADMMLKRSARFAGKNFNDFSQEDMGELRGVYAAIHGSAPKDDGALRGFADGLGDQKNWNGNYTALSDYYHKQGMPMSSDYKIGKTVGGADAGGSKKDEIKAAEMPKKIEDYVTQNLSILSLVVTKFDAAARDLMSIHKRLQAEESKH